MCDKAIEIISDFYEVEEELINQAKADDDLGRKLLHDYAANLLDRLQSSILLASGVDIDNDVKDCGCIIICDHHRRTDKYSQYINELENDKIQGWVDSAFDQVAKTLGFSSPTELRDFVEEHKQSYMTHDEWIGAQETTIKEQHPWGFCPVCQNPVEVDMEEFQMHAGEAWEDLLSLAMKEVKPWQTDEESRKIAEKHGVPLWCEDCNEPLDDLIWLVSLEEEK